MNNPNNRNWGRSGYTGNNNSSGAPFDAAQAYYLLQRQQQQHQQQAQQNQEESRATEPCDNTNAGSLAMGNADNNHLLAALNSGSPSDRQNLIGMVQANHHHQQQLHLHHHHQQQARQFGSFPVQLMTANQNAMGSMIPQQPYAQWGGYGAGSAMQLQQQQQQQQAAAFSPQMNTSPQPTPFQQIQGLLEDPNLDTRARRVLSNISGQLASEWDSSSQNLAQILAELTAAAERQQQERATAQPTAAAAAQQQQQQPSNNRTLTAEEKATSDAFLLRLLNMAKRGASDDAFAQLMSAVPSNLSLQNAVAAAAAPVSTSTTNSGDGSNNPVEQEESRKRAAEDDPPTRKPRKKRDKNMPKGPLSAYNFYFKAECKHIQRGGTGEKGYVHLARTVSGRWKELGDETKAPYIALAAEDRARYDREMDVYRRRFVNKADDGEESSGDEGEDADKDEEPSDKEEEKVESSSNGSIRSNNSNEERGSKASSNASTDDSDQDRKPAAQASEPFKTDEDGKDRDDEGDDDGPDGSTAVQA